MTLVTALAIVRMVLAIVTHLTKQAEREALEKAVLDDLLLKQKERVDAAVAARDDILSGRVPDDPADPNRRD